MGVDINFLKNGHVCLCVINELGHAAVKMYRDQAERLKFKCDHGEGEVRTRFESKMLGELCGMYFEATVESSNGGSVPLSFIASERQLYADAEREGRTGVWTATFSGHTFRDPPAEMIN